MKIDFIPSASRSLALVVLGLGALNIFGASKAANAAPAARPEEIEVDQIRERYWAQGKDAEVGVVQNRVYSKRNKLEFGINGGNWNGDPFLSTYTLGLNLGYHFTEYLSVHAMGMRIFNSPSSALNTLTSDTSVTANTIETRSLIGGEVRGSLLYGKLSLLGEAILYFDAFVSIGGARVGTEFSGSFGQFVGIGQQIHISQLLSVNIDYRFIHYNADAYGKNKANYGKYLGSRSLTAGLVTLGVSGMFSLGGR